MKKEEVNYLIDLKTKDGKSQKQAYEEINRDIKFLQKHKEKVREAKQEIKELEKQKKQLKIRFNKDFKKLTKVKEPKLSKTSRNSASTYHLSRILNYLSENNNQTKTDITRETCMCVTYVADGLKFLIKLKKVKESRSNNGVSIYNIL